MELLLFVMFGLVLGGVALSHHHARNIAVGGFIAILGATFILVPEFSLLVHFTHEAPTIFNLAVLLVGFAILAGYFTQSRLPEVIPRVLPDDWKGGFSLLIGVFVLSSFLDNIAAAMIGGVIARQVYAGRVSIGFLAAIVFASNGGGAGSVVGDTTTTMIWLAGYSVSDVIHAYAGAIPAVAFSAYFAAKAQQRYQPIQKDPASANVQIDWTSLGLVGLILVAAIITNLAAGLPAVGVILAIAVGCMFRTPNWHEAKEAAKGAVFLLSLVLSASLMPVEVMQQYMAADPVVTFALGWVSAVFDNIPLTALALRQGGYDVGFLAYAVGVGGSLTWFGSSAGVALTNDHPEGRNLYEWTKQGWHVPAGYVVGYVVLTLLVGWHPHALSGVGLPTSH